MFSNNNILLWPAHKLKSICIMATKHLNKNRSQYFGEVGGVLTL